MIFPSVANGNITPARFVKVDTTTDNHVLQCGANEKCVGISQKGQRSAPYPGLQDGYAAIAGESLQVWSLDETAPLEYGGTVAAGDYLESDASGRGVACTVDGHYYGAIAGQAGVIGQVCEVLVVLGQKGP
jgi:hypothetical protein